MTTLTRPGRAGSDLIGSGAIGWDDGAAKRPDGIIGPNAITRMEEVLSARLGPPTCRAIFSEAGIARHLLDRPTAMVDERDVARLHLALVDRVGPEAAAELSWEAGRLTGDYLLANRIPELAQAVLKRLPRFLAARILVAAIARHAWTFAGSGTFSYDFTDGLMLQLKGSPVCRLLTLEQPACHYFAGTFERVFAAMLGPGLRVRETVCEATGADACRFRVTW